MDETDVGTETAEETAPPTDETPPFDEEEASPETPPTDGGVTSDEVRETAKEAVREEVADLPDRVAETEVVQEAARRAAAEAVADILPTDTVGMARNTADDVVPPVFADVQSAGAETVKQANQRMLGARDSKNRAEKALERHRTEALQIEQVLIAGVAAADREVLDAEDNAAIAAETQIATLTKFLERIRAAREARSES